MGTVSSKPVDQLQCRRVMPRRWGRTACVRASAQKTTLALVFRVHHALQAHWRLLEAGFLPTACAHRFTMSVPMAPALDARSEELKNLEVKLLLSEVGKRQRE